MKSEFYCVDKCTWEGYAVDSFWRSKEEAKKRCRILRKEHRKMFGKCVDESVDEKDRWRVTTYRFEESKSLCDSCSKHNVSCLIEPADPVTSCVEYKP